MVKWIVIFLLVLLCFRLFFFFGRSPDFRDGQKVVIETVLAAEPVTQGRFQRFFVRSPKGNRVFITTTSYPRYSYAQRLRITGVIQKRDNGAYNLSFPSIDQMQTSSFLTGVLSFFGTIRSHIIGFFQAVLPASAAGLLLGIVFGIREQIPPEFNRAFQSSGVLHVVAASGANVSIVISMVASVFMMVFTRRFALFLIIPAVFCYSLLAGFDPPIVRAAIMGLLAILAGLFGRQYLGILALGMTGWFMLMVWPYLLFDVGFQLSFLATLGIILIKPLLPASQAERGGQGENGAGGPFQSVKRVMFLPIEDIRTTLAAQIATLPVLFFFFGQYGILSLLANAATLWMIPVLMILGLFAALLSFIPLVSIVANGLLLLALPLLLLFEKIIFVVGDLHTDILFTPPLAMVAGYYFLLGAVILFCKNSKLKVKN